MKINENVFVDDDVRLFPRAPSYDHDDVHHVDQFHDYVHVQLKNLIENINHTLIIIKRESLCILQFKKQKRFIDRNTITFSYFKLETV